MSEPKRTPEGRAAEGSHFIREIIAADVQTGKHGRRVATRFPPEPNGFLHIGHAKSICLNFGMAKEFGGTCNLRFDDTNPTTEDVRYAQSIEEAVRWLGFEWSGKYYASDYFEQLYQWAEQLIRQGDAYVCSLTEAQMREYRGTVTEPGRPSPDRDRSPQENLELFRRMRKGEFEDGKYTLRAKIDMANPNFKMRDPPLYRIRHAHHWRTADTWCLYPLYDYAHCLSDAIEKITHSICTLEFENNRELYDWIVAKVGFEQPPHQYEFARLNLTHMMMSKRKLNVLVQEKRVSGWDDPRLPTLLGLRRRGYTPEAIRAFCEDIGVAKANSVIDVARLEQAVRDDLDKRSARAMAVLRPLKLVVTNYPENKDESFDAPMWPEESGRTETRPLPFSRTLWVEQDDFAEEPPKGWYRLAPGQEVRLRHAYLVTVREVVKDAAGNVTELRATYDPDSRGGNAPDGRKVRGTIHWVSAKHAVDAEVRLYDHLFTQEDPEDVPEGKDWRDMLNPQSLVTVPGAKVEPALARAKEGSPFQFERQGFFVVDRDSTAGKQVFNRTVQLKDTFQKKPAAPKPEVKAAPAKAQQALPSLEERVQRLAAEAQQAFAQLEKQGLSKEDALQLAQDVTVRPLFDQAVALGAAPKSVARWVANELPRFTKERPLKDLPVTPDGLAELAKLVDAGTISGTSAKEVFEEHVRTGASPLKIVEAKGLQQLGGDALAPLVEQVLQQNAAEVERYRAGNKNLLGFFLGQAMRASGGKADAKALRELVVKKLG